MTIDVKVIAHSWAKETMRELATLEVRYPRFIHAEMMTHRVFSRNASSSRAIPTKRMHDTVRQDLALPERWVMNEPGMQGYVEASPDLVRQAEAIMSAASQSAIRYAEQLDKLGFHKQHVNRITEPYQHIRTVWTSSQWNNFFILRTDPTAEPTMQVLASKVRDAVLGTEPRTLQRGEWHLPYVDSGDLEYLDYVANQYRESSELATYADWFPPHAGTRGLFRFLTIAVSAARCARVSYNNFEGKVSTLDEDIELFKKLIVSHPVHASPVEHQATPDYRYNITDKWVNPNRHGNLIGWQQARKFVPGENGDA